MKRNVENRDGKPVALKPDIRDAIGVFLTRLERSDLPAVARVLLYGSHARGEAHAESDIDLAVVLAGDARPALNVTYIAGNCHASAQMPFWNPCSRCRPCSCGSQCLTNRT